MNLSKIEIENPITIKRAESQSIKLKTSTLSDKEETKSNSSDSPLRNRRRPKLASKQSTIIFSANFHGSKFGQRRVDQNKKY